MDRAPVQKGNETEEGGTSRGPVFIQKFPDVAPSHYDAVLSHNVFHCPFSIHSQPIELLTRKKSPAEET